MQGIVTESFHYFLLFQTCAFFKKEREWEKYLKTMLCMGRNAWEEYYSKVCRQGRKFHVILKNLKSLLEVVIVNNMQLHASPGHKSKRKLKNCNSKMYEFFSTVHYQKSKNLGLHLMQRSSSFNRDIVLLKEASKESLASLH